MSSREVLSIIASLDGAFNGEFPGKQIGVEVISDTEAFYTLTEWVIEEGGTLGEKVGEERYHLSLTPVETLEEEPPVADEIPDQAEEPSTVDFP